MLLQPEGFNCCFATRLNNMNVLSKLLKGNVMILMGFPLESVFLCKKTQYIKKNVTELPEINKIIVYHDKRPENYQNLSM